MQLEMYLKLCQNKNINMKTKFKKSKPTIVLIAIVFLVASLVGCKKSKTPTPNISSSDYSSIKTSDWRNRIGDTIAVEGYYNEESGFSKLYSNPEDAMTDRATPEERYIWISKPTNLTFVPNYSNFIGRKVKITGVLQAVSEGSIVTSSRIFGDPSLAGIRVIRIQDDSLNATAFRPSTLINFCDKYPNICQLFTPVGTKVAFLYSGGINVGSAHHRYWNDIYVMYGILKHQYGFTDANIIVCYKAGVADDHASEVPVDFAATPSGFDSAIALVKSKMNRTSKFFCFINNHGGTLTDDDGDDNRGTINDNIDEQIYYYNSSTTFRDEDLADKINTLTFGTGIFLLKPCFSGGLVYDLRGANRVLISAGHEFEVTHGHSSGNFGDLTFHFLAAITGQKPDGSGAVDADTDNDGKVSMKEVFDYIRANHTPIDHPQYNDDGTGNLSDSSPSSSSFGAGVFL